MEMHATNPQQQQQSNWPQQVIDGMPPTTNATGPMIPDQIAQQQGQREQDGAPQAETSNGSPLQCSGR